MTRSRGRKSLHVAGILALLAQPSVSLAQTPGGAQSAVDAKKACIVQHESAQTLRRSGKLLEARDAALVCSRDECPAAVRSDCGDWLDSMNKAIPSLVMRAKSDGKDVFDVRVSIDGTVITSHLDGTPFELNPGPHTLRFEYAGFDAIPQEILVLEGEKNRVVEVSFAKAVPLSKEAPVKAPEPAAPPPSEQYRPTPVMTYVLGGVAVAGAAGFAAFGLSGQNKKKGLESSCRPTCTNSEIKPVKTQFVLADASLGVAIAATIAAGVLYFTRPSEPLPGASQGKAARPRSPIAIGFSPTPRGAEFALQAEF